MNLTIDLRHPSKMAPQLSRHQLLCAKRLPHCVLFGLLAAIGLLAFMFSAVSPYDDDVQQEFVQGNKPKRFAAAQRKVALEVQTFGTHRVRCAFLPQLLLLTCCGVKRGDAVADQEILRTIPSSETGDRSPPSRSS